MNRMEIYYLMKNVQPKALLFRYSSCSWHLMSELLSANPNLPNSNYRYLAVLENMAQWPKNSRYAKKYNGTRRAFTRMVFSLLRLRA